MAEPLVSLGLTELAAEQAKEWALARRSTAPVSDPGPDLPYESDVIAPSMNIGREITPSDIVSARTQARAGKPKQWFEIYDEMRRNGPGPQLSKSTLALSSAAVTFLPPEQYRDEADTSADAALARKIATVVAGQYGPRMTGALSDWFEKLSHGVVGFHQITEPRGVEGRYEKVTTLEKIPARRFEIDDARAWVYRPFPNDASTAPCEPFVKAGSLAVFAAGSGSVPLDMAGLNFECIVPWSFASFAHRHLARLSELFGIPWRVVWYDETKKGQKEIAQRSAQKMGAAAWGAFPKGMEVEIKAALSGTGAGEVQEKLIRIADRSYDRVYLGHSQASNVEVGAGSRTSTDEASEQSRDIHRARANEASADFTAGLIRPYVLRNFGPDAAARLCPEVCVTIKERKDGLKLAQTAATLTTAGVTTIDEESLVRDCGLVYQPNPEKAVKPRASAQPFAAPAEPAAKLAAVVPFPGAHRFAEETDAFATPDAAAEELLAPYRAIFVSALHAGESPSVALDRVLLRARKRPEAKRLVEQLQAVTFAATCQGVDSVRSARATGDR